MLVTEFNLTPISPSLANFNFHGNNYHLMGNVLRHMIP